MPDETAKGNAERSAKIDGKVSEMAELREICSSDSEARPALDACYGQIGISAVAAAAQYQGHAKNLAYAPAPNDWRDQYAKELA